MDMDTEEMAKHIKAASGSQGNLDEKIRVFNNALTSSLDAVAPVQTKQVTIHSTVPWFTDDARHLKNMYEEKGGHLEEI